MKRKIIKQGHNTLTVTLPSDWVKRFNLDRGKEVEMIEKDNGLFITTEKTSEKRKVEFNIEGLDIPTIWKYFMAVYREGYDEITVRFKSAEKFETPYKFLTSHRLDYKYKKGPEKITALNFLQGFVSRFIGLEIVEQGKDFVLIKEMTESTSKEFDNSLRRVMFLIQQMCEDSLEAIKTETINLLYDTHDVDINLDKFHDYCIRILNKTNNREPRKSELLFSTLFLLELLGDEFKNISVHLTNDFKTKKFRNVEGFFEYIKESFNLYVSLFYKFDIGKIKKISEIDKESYLKVPSMYKKASEEGKEILHHLRMISRYINSLTELRIEMEF